MRTTGPPSAGSGARPHNQSRTAPSGPISPFVAACHGARSAFSAFSPRRVALSYAEQLESCQTAIAAIEARGQAYTIDGRALTRADLATLYEREQWLRGQAAREARGGGMRMRLGRPFSS
jgi:hypothetical protein